MRRMLLCSIFPLAFCIYVAPVFLDYGGGECLQDERRYTTHSDYLWGLKWVKWQHTVLCGIDPPRQIGGNQDYHDGPHGSPPKPIPPAGEWQISYAAAKTRSWKVYLPYAAVTLRGNYHARVGLRWDDKDNLYLPTLSIKKIPPNWGVLLWHRQQHMYQG